jgi:hypothetical protein
MHVSCQVLAQDGICGGALHWHCLTAVLCSCRKEEAEAAGPASPRGAGTPTRSDPPPRALSLGGGQGLPAEAPTLQREPGGGASPSLSRGAHPFRDEAESAGGGGSHAGDHPGDYAGGGPGGGDYASSGLGSRQPSGQSAAAGSRTFGGLDELMDGGGGMLPETRALEAANERAAEARALRRANM